MTKIFGKAFLLIVTMLVAPASAQRASVRGAGRSNNQSPQATAAVTSAAEAAAAKAGHTTPGIMIAKVAPLAILSPEGLGGSAPPEGLGGNGLPPGGNVAPGDVDECRCKCAIARGVEGFLVTFTDIGMENCMLSASAMDLVTRGQATCSTCDDETP